MELRELGERIKVGRISRNMTQSRLAALVGVAASTVGMWEQGRREPDLDTIEALADIYNVPVSYFIDKDDIVITDGSMTKKDKARLEALHQNPRLGLLFDRQRNMSESDIEMMIGLAERIMKEREPD